MVFVQEEEVFPIVDASDLPVKKEDNDAVVVAVEEKRNGKRKPEESADKKDTEKKVGWLSKCVSIVSFIFGGKLFCLESMPTKSTKFCLIFLDYTMHFIL